MDDDMIKDDATDEEEPKEDELDSEDDLGGLDVDDELLDGDIEV